MTLSSEWPRLILASGSPRRAQLLAEAGFAFEVIPANVDEDCLAQDLAPAELPIALAAAKAEAVATRFSEQAAVVIGADTVAYAGGEILGKPVDRADADRMIRLLSGSLHSVATGFCIVCCRTGASMKGKVRSDVLMRPLTEEEIRHYLDSGEWEGKAGGYGIQDTPGRDIGSGDPFIEQISGELTNIVGLPMPQVIDELERLGVRPRQIP